MEFRRCMPPCTRFIAREDPHSKCILCLGFSHAREAVYGTSNCEICDDFRLITLRSRLEDYECESSKFSRRASSTNAPPREIAASREAAASRRAASWGSDVELEEMESEQTGLAFSLPPSSERARANSPVEFLPDFQFPSPKARDFVSFGLDDILHTAASDSEDFGPALADALPPNSQEARPSAAYSELVDVLSRATEKLALDWPDEPRESRASKLDDRFLIGAHSKLERRKLPFFSDLHREISSSWKQPFSSRLTNAAAADFTNLVGSVEQGYTAMPVIEDTLASHLSPSLAPSWKSRPLLPSKPCRTTSALIGKSYIAAGQAGMALHTMAILQAYQADVLKEMDEGTGLTPEAVKELRRATDLALRATKHTARAVGRSMAASVAAERHLWLNLTEIREREKTFLMDAPISQSGLFGEAVSAVVDKFRSAKTQSAALNQFMPRRARDFSTPSSSVSREQPPPRREPPSGGAQATRLPPTTVWGAQHFSLRHPEQGRRGLSFTVEGAAASRPSRHPISGMSSLARHYDSSVTLPSRMGAFTRGIAVGSPHNSNRLHSSVWEKSPPFRRGSPDSRKPRRQGFCSTTGTFLPPAERSNRGSTADGSRTRFLQPLLPRSKEGRRLEAYPGSTAFESFPLQREVQNADDENHHVSGSGGRLVCHHRPEGCVFSHPGRSQTQEIPSVRLWREGLPIQGSALRPGFGPEDIYQMHGCCTGPFEAPGHPCTELSGRLAHSGSLQGASESSQGYRSRPHPFSWPQNERQEECAPPISTNCISRSSFGFRSDAGPFGSCPDTSFYSMFGPLQARPSCLCRYLPQAVGPYGSSLPCVAPRAASHEAIPLVDEGAEVTPHCTSYSPCQSVAQLLSTPVNVARPRLSPERGENGCDPPSPYDHDGRINDRLGRGLRRKAGEWRVEGRVPLLAYKLPGTQGCLPGFEVFSPRSRGASCHSQDGQYGGCVPHKPPRRFKVAHPGQACAPSSPLVSRQVPLFEGGSRSGSTEPGGRFSVETEAQAGGMDVEPSDGIPDLGSVWQSGGGPLCFSRVIPVPALVLPEFPDDSRHRCVRPPMAECQSVRVSANKADSGSTMQSEGERCPSPSHSPILALPDLVLGANSPLVSASLGDSDQAGLTVPASGQDLASSAGALEVVGMAHTGPRAVIDGLPAEVQETIASARAPATRKLYSSKWGVFESWCLTRAIDPVNCPVGPVLEFLQERLTAGAAATTLRVYVAAIAARRELDEIPLGRHRLVSAFMRGARRLRPVRPTAVPSWDLSVVLEGLVTAPFEPLESASDRILTLKVVLLLALTSLKRVGDLQAFSVSETCMDFAPGLVKVTLRPRPGYIPKVLSTSFRSQVVTLHSFHPPPFASSEDERLHMLCLVRALKLYVDRSKVWRKSPQLLICFGAGRRGLATSKQRISHWVRDAISLAYEARELPSPLSLRAHSTRGVASSQALFRGVPLEDICVAAGWSSPHTFVRFYNLDVDTAPGSQVLSV